MCKRMVVFSIDMPHHLSVFFNPNLLSSLWVKKSDLSVSLSPSLSLFPLLPFQLTEKCQHCKNSERENAFILASLTFYVFFHQTPPLTFTQHPLPRKKWGLSEVTFLGSWLYHSHLRAQKIYISGSQPFLHHGPLKVKKNSTDPWIIKVY